MPEFTYRLPWHRRLSFGIGHVLNDLCASMWFSYLLVYLHNVLNFSNSNAGYLLLLGQIADAISTPLVGYESDHTNGFCKYTKRKSWHLLGTLCVVATFPFLFMPCISCEHTADWRQFIYYAPFVVIFQFGWASTQINHLSLIPELTPNDDERVELNAIRYAFTVCSNIAVYLIAWILLMKGSAGDDASQLGPDDIDNFRTLVLIVVGVGIFFSIMFHVFTQERRNESLVQGRHLPYGLGGRMLWKDWLKEYQFYMVALIYMCTRLVVNVSQIYLPMYLTDSLQLSKIYIALVPLVVFISGFLVSFLMRPVNRLAGRKITYVMGIVLVLGCCVWMLFLRENTEKEVFGAAILLGAGGSTMLVTSLSLTADLIGDRTESGAFVYGAMSFTDKLSNGIAVVIIQRLHPCTGSACCAACVWFYRDMIVFVPGGFACIALILIIIISPITIGQLRKTGDLNETTPLLGGKSARKEGGDSEEDLSCCSYLCCATLSSAPHVHKITVCDSCGEEACHQRRLQAAESDPMRTYECIDSLVKSGGRCQRSIQENLANNADGMGKTASSIERELNECTGSGSIEETQSSGSENSFKKDKKGGKRSNQSQNVSVDVHA